MTNPAARFVAPQVARELLGVSRGTLARYELDGKLPNTRRLLGTGHRRYNLGDLARCLPATRAADLAARADRIEGAA